MSKDLLESVSKFFTENKLKEIVAKQLNENIKDIAILSWEFSDASKKGDSYLSTVDRVAIKCKVKNQIKEVKIVVKSLPNNKGRRATYRSTDFFANEITFYVEIAAKFQEFLHLKNQSSLWLIPKCLAYHLDGENDFIALEDVSPQGFGPVARESCLTFEQCRYILEAMARFHGVSFAYKDQNKEDYQNRASKLSETYFSDHLYETWYKRFHCKLVDIAKDALAKEYPGSKGERQFNIYTPGELYKKSAKFCTRTDALTSVINQGDSWAPNFLIKLNSLGKFDVLMLDFQLARCCSPVLDLAFFMYSCTDQALRNEHYDDLLKIYHNELSNSIKALGSEPENIYPWELFLQEVKEQFIHGVSFGIESVTFSLLSTEEVFDLGLIKEDKMDIADVWTVKNIETSEKRRRLADIILHATDKGYL
ncbi:uncharacterized protein LOC131663681 [Phymastichus coffea]|uniref:uncharacterized protein LOC131663681 n=1 Tax=Phymastichus coffea TaxID=108790 RepID=UPI00273C7139|nr:uncharacterized protein LOC131663681 [Phymastichus coffea]XP_058790197.1 uncharacterized protein LOC131663681 [Phymastichus coffea]